MVNYKVRAFYEKDTGSVGADLIIYSDTGDVIDTLLITTQGQYNELVSRLDGIDQQYLDLNELKQYLQNTGDTEITINATKLNGLTVEEFARQNHNHDDLYARKNHADPQPDYGVGAPDTYGHNKVIDNCNQTVYRAGESLSAYQGKLLNDRINAMQPKLEDTGWDSIPLTQSSLSASNFPCCRKYGKLVILDFHAEMYKKFSKNTTVFTLKSQYCPNHNFYGFAYKGGTGDCITFSIDTSGNLKFGGDLANGTAIRLNECFFTG